MTNCIDKFLVFTNDYNLDGALVPRDFFTTLGIGAYDRMMPVCFDANGRRTDLLSNALLIVVPDQDIIGGKAKKCIEAYKVLQQLRDNDFRLAIVRHHEPDGWNYHSRDDSDPVREYLKLQPEIVASHRQGSFYCTNLKTIVQAIRLEDPVRYKRAIEDAKGGFLDLALERELKEQYKRHAFDLHQLHLDLSNRKLIFIVNDKSRVEANSENTQFATIDSEDSFRSFHFDQSHAEGVVVLAELTWNDRPHSDFYGLEILERLRFEHRLKCKIVICSLKPWEFLRRRFPILEFTQYHPLVKPPVHSKTLLDVLDKSKAIENEGSLHGIIRDYCHPVGKWMYLLSHGRGISPLWKARSETARAKDIIERCREDLTVLERYLAGWPSSSASTALDETVVSVGRKLQERLKEGVDAEDINILFSARDIIIEMSERLNQFRGQYA